MIYASLFDAGTDLRRRPSNLPGLDTAWAPDANFEERTVEFVYDRKVEYQNAQMRELGPVNVRAWPVTMPRKVWLDRTHRYAWNGTDGFGFNLYHVDRVAGDFPPIPGGDPRLELNADDPEVERAAGRLLREYDWREVRARAEVPADWYRLDTLNESGGTVLEEPLGLRIPDVRGAVALELVDNSLFAPFDLRQGTDRYLAVDAENRPLADPNGERLYLHPRGRYNLYLRPRRWRWFVTVYATFYYISIFEFFPVTLVFPKAWYDTPPRYPMRHRILDTSPDSTDPAIVDAFDSSRAAADLRSEILDAQYWTPCEAFVFGDIELVQMWLERYPPRRDEYALGIGQVDDATGKESLTWIRNRLNLDAAYPKQTIAFFENVPWFITP